MGVIYGSHSASYSLITPIAKCAEPCERHNSIFEPNLDKDMSVWVILSTWMCTSGLRYRRDLRNSFHYKYFLPLEYIERFKLAATVHLA